MTDRPDIPPTPPEKPDESSDGFFAAQSSSSSSNSEIETVILKTGTEDDRPQSQIDTDIRGDRDPNATVVDQAAVIEHMGRNLLEPVEHLIGEHATRVERVRALVRDLDSNYLRVLLVLEGLSLIGMVGIVSFIDIPDGFMYVIMEFLIGLTLLRYIRTCVDEAGARRWAVGLLVIILSLVWVGLLFNKVPPEPQWYDPERGIRPELPHLWGPIAGHLAVVLGIAVHLPLRKYLRARR